MYSQTSNGEEFSNSSRAASPTPTTAIPAIFVAVDRTGFPAEKKRAQPWKDMNLVILDDGEGPLRVDREGWNPVLVACTKNFDNGKIKKAIGIEFRPLSLSIKEVCTALKPA